MSFDNINVFNNLTNKADLILYQNIKILYPKILTFSEENGALERHQNNNLKAILSFSNYIGQASLNDINKKEDVLLFLQTKISTKN
jgi:hypothetical protein